MIVVIIAAGGTAFALIRKDETKETAKTTSPAKTAQDDYSEGDDRPTNGQSTGNNQGGATDNNGQAPADPGTTTGSVTSPSGVITVKNAANNMLLSPGSTLYGTAQGVSHVQFRVIDNEVGVLAQGTLQVVDGAFSGKLSFTPKTDSGRLDVFTVDSLGSEANNTEIPVRFK